MIVSCPKVSVSGETWKQPLTDFYLLLSNESQIVSGAPPAPAKVSPVKVWGGEGSGELVMLFLP